MKSRRSVCGLEISRWLLAGAIATTLVGATAGAQTMYRRAFVDSTEQLRLVTTTGQTISPPKDSGQVGFAFPAISANRLSVGWLSLYANCCTSYPIPLKLVVRTADKDRVFDGSGLPIWKWVFVDDGKRVAYRQVPVHGDVPAHYELREVGTGQVVEAYDDSTDRSGTSKNSRGFPGWVRAVDQAKVPPIQ